MSAEHVKTILTRLKLRVAKTPASATVAAHVEPYQMGFAAACSVFIKAIDEEIETLNE